MKKHACLCGLANEANFLSIFGAYVCVCLPIFTIIWACDLQPFLRQREIASVLSLLSLFSGFSSWSVFIEGCSCNLFYSALLLVFRRLTNKWSLLLPYLPSVLFSYYCPIIITAQYHDPPPILRQRPHPRMYACIYRCMYTYAYINMYVVNNFTISHFGI